MASRSHASTNRRGIKQEVKNLRRGCYACRSTREITDWWMFSGAVVCPFFDPFLVSSLSCSSTCLPSPFHVSSLTCTSALLTHFAGLLTYFAGLLTYFTGLLSRFAFLLAVFRTDVLFYFISLLPYFSILRLTIVRWPSCQLFASTNFETTNPTSYVSQQDVTLQVGLTLRLISQSSNFKTTNQTSYVSQQATFHSRWRSANAKLAFFIISNSLSYVTVTNKTLSSEVVLLP